MSNTEDYDHIFKILIIGASNVGKSSILLRFTDDTFEEEVGTTIGVDFKVKYFNVKQKKIKLTLWDTAGQERFRTLTSSFYRNAHGVILVYDVTNRDSFESLSQWLKEVESFSSYPNIVKLLVGNKIDKVEEREILRKEGETFAKDKGMLFIESSAKTKEGIDDTFQEISYKILQTESLIKNTKPVNLDKIDFDEEKEDEESESGFCCSVL